MKATLKLNNPLWQTAQRKVILDRAVQQSGAELESRIKSKILTGPKSGKLYRKSAIKRKIAKRDLGFFRSNQRIFRRTFTDLYKEKTTVGYNIHRASKRGESPATDSRRLLNSIRAVKLGMMSVRIATSVRYAVYLDSNKYLGRLFFEVTAQEFKPTFKQNIREAIPENS
jgi:hypothetical protein